MSDETEQTQEDVSELRKAAEGGKAAKAEAEALRRELAFTKAGIDTSSKPAQALIASYTGELNAEAIKAEAAEWGLIQSEAPKTESQAPDYSDDAALQQMRDASAGNPAPDVQVEKPAIERALASFTEDREAGFGQSEATNRAIGRMIQAAAAGDKTALFDERAWQMKQQEAGHGAHAAR
jgi:hypothetical protein